MFEFRNKELWSQWAPLALRLVIGYGFIVHGWAKLSRGVHLQYGFSSVNTVGLTAAGPQFGPPGFEVNLLYIAGLLAIVLGGGAGAWSVDRLIARRSSGA